MHDVEIRWKELQQGMPELRLYALVDGVQYQRQFERRLQRHIGILPLFAGTPDEPLAHAGPWLIDTELADRTVVDELANLESRLPAVSWVIAYQDMEGLGQLLQLHLNVKLPDGRTALLRFWDPRVLGTLSRVLSHHQRIEFFGHIHEWHLLHEGQRVWIGRQHADAL